MADTDPFKSGQRQFRSFLSSCGLSFLILMNSEE